MAGPSTGKFDRRISIEVSTETKDAAGDPVQSWAHSFYLFARRIQQSGSSAPGREVSADNVQLRQSDIIWQVRWSARSAALGPETHRIVYKGRVYEILGLVEGEGRSERISMRCATRPDQRGTMAPEVVS